MRLLVLSALVLGMTASAYAVPPTTGNAYHFEPRPTRQYENPGIRVTGDTVADPFIIGALPFVATGSTCGFNNDYDEVCPYSGSTSPDVVYKYVASQAYAVSIDLCQSTYDTKVYVYQNAVGNLIACNDDACAFQSQLHNVPLAAGNTYYIVIDGYGGSCGSYYLDVSPYVDSCQVTCPDYAIPEGEPDCYDNYNDLYNSGCNALPPAFQVLQPSDDPIAICGTTGVYSFNTILFRDTDWFEINLTAPANICLSGDARVPCYFFIIDGRNGCDNPPIVMYANVFCGQVDDLCYPCDVGTWWLWVGPSAWDTSYTCGSHYWMGITGYTGGCSPTDPTTWGSIKTLYK
jgi:hypothetical protein